LYYGYCYDRFGELNATEYCSITDVYPGFIFDDVYTTYQANSFYALADNIISLDYYCTWDYGILSDVETCTTTIYYANDDATSYTNIDVIDYKDNHIH
jgi:hypothetical protein